MERTKPINPNKITKETHSTSKYPLARRVLLRGAYAHSNSMERKVPLLIRKESLLKSFGKKAHLVKPQPRKKPETLEAVEQWGTGAKQGQKGGWWAGTLSEEPRGGCANIGGEPFEQGEGGPKGGLMTDIHDAVEETCPGALSSGA